jgi:DNA-binding NarL/FixJ family response regulator
MKSNKKKPVELTKSEIRIIQLICKELPTSVIAEKLKYSPRTVEGYRQDIMKKIGAKNVIGIALFAIREKIIKL